MVLNENNWCNPWANVILIFCAIYACKIIWNYYLNFTIWLIYAISDFESVVLIHFDIWTTSHIWRCSYWCIHTGSVTFSLFVHETANMMLAIPKHLTPCTYANKYKSTHKHLHDTRMWIFCINHSCIHKQTITYLKVLYSPEMRTKVCVHWATYSYYVEATIRMWRMHTFRIYYLPIHIFVVYKFICALVKF